MRVTAKKDGFYAGSRVRRGQSFTLTDPKNFSDRWMVKGVEKIEPEKPAKNGDTKPPAAAAAAKAKTGSASDLA